MESRNPSASYAGQYQQKPNLSIILPGVGGMIFAWRGFENVV
jgi:hypothetical protein